MPIGSAAGGAATSAADADAAPVDTGNQRATGSEPSSGNWLHVVFAVLLVGAVAFLVAMAQPALRPAAGLSVGQPAPDFTLETFDGATIHLADLRGQVVVVNFWASWCKPCEEEAADLEAVWREYRDRGVVLLGVDYTDTRPAALEYIKRFDITYPNGPDLGSRISRAYRVKGVPETLVIDRDGNIVPLDLGDGVQLDRLTGPIVPGSSFTPADLRALLTGLIAGGANDG